MVHSAIGYARHIIQRKYVLFLIIMIMLVGANAHSLPFVATIGAGIATQDISVSGSAGRDVPSLSGDDASWNISLSFDLYKSISIGIGYVDYGEADDSYTDRFGDTIEDEVDVSTSRLFASWKPSLSRNFGLHFGVGAEKWGLRVEETDSSMPGEVFRSSDDGIDIFYEAGLRYDISKHTVIGLTASYIELDVDLDTGVDLDNDVTYVRLELGRVF